MSTTRGPLFTDGDTTGAVRVWSGGDTLFATVVVKACFTLAHDRPAQIAPAEPVLAEDRTFGNHPMRSVERAAEDAPHLPRCDVLLTGHAHAPGGRPSTSVRLAVFKDKTALVDRTIHVFGDRKSGGAPQAFERMELVYERAFGGAGVEANPVGSATPNLVDPKDPHHPAAFGPVSRFWPARKKRIAGLPPLAPTLPSIPDSFPWDHFQAAPPEQQTPFLAGDEWIVLDGMHPQLPRVQSRLPGAMAVARVVTRGGEAPVALHADMLIIDAARGTCAVVWRGRVAVQGGEQGLSSMAVVAGLELPGRPIRWENLLANARSAIAKPMPEMDATLGAPGPVPAAAPRAAVPVSAAAPAPTAGAAVAPASIPPSKPVEVGESTMGLSDAQQAAQSLRAVAPFQVAPSAPPAAAPISKKLDATPWGGPVASTPAGPVGESTLPIAAPASPPPAPAATPPLVTGATPPFVPGATPPFVPGATPPLAGAATPHQGSSAPFVAPVATPHPSPTALPSFMRPASVTHAPIQPVAPPEPPPTPDVAAPSPPAANTASPRSLASLEERLRAAGTPAEDLALLIAALQPKAS